MKTKFSLLNKVALITGGGSGMIAIIFAEQGADVKILDIDTNNAKKTVEDIVKKFKASMYNCDVSNLNQVISTINEINKLKPIDILVNNAGIAHIGNIEACEEHELDNLYNINIKGVYNPTKVCVPLMKNNNGGVILNIGSIASSVGINDRFAYSMTKGAVLSMTYSVAKDYLNHNIRCKIHTPFVDGFIRNNYPGKEKQMFENLSKSQPIGRMGKPNEIADLALFL